MLSVLDLVNLKPSEETMAVKKKETSTKNEKSSPKKIAKKHVKTTDDEAKASTKKEKSSPKKTTDGYGVDYIAEQLGKAPNLVRVALRTKGVKKEGKSYSWSTKAEADAVVKQLKAD